MTTFHDFTLKTIDGEDQPLSEYEGKAVLVVNVASKCGLTPQYEGLQKLHEERADDGLVVAGIPCNQFGKQEPGTHEEIKQFVSEKYGVTFPMFGKVDVNGEDRHPLYAWLTAQDTSPDGAGDIAWNFAKFVIGKDGRVKARFEPQTATDDDALRKAIDEAL